MRFKNMAKDLVLRRMPVIFPDQNEMCRDKQQAAQEKDVICHCLRVTDTPGEKAAV